ncbi:hypothetical protein ACH5RR_003603 [Cinchona calisaya]|uniref:Uncharacterized protein n=1 Tax=Cinchona calisaya TaxID=153742 RepID=A0ABD3AV96_9GENT
MVVVEEWFFYGNNENLFKNKVTNSEGLALFSIINTFKTLAWPHLDYGNEIELVKNDCHIVVPFNLLELFTREGNLGPNLERETLQFLSNTVEILGELISIYLFTHFKIDPQTILNPNCPRTVIVVELIRSQRVFFDNVNDSYVRIFKFLPPEIPLRRWVSKVTKKKDEVEDEEENDDAITMKSSIIYAI